MEFISGMFSGLMQNLIGHPFDTAKVLQQNGRTPFLKNPLHYYRGLQYPTIMMMITQGINFDILHKSYIYTNNYYISGMLSGIITSPFHYFFDYYKIKKQMNKENFSLNEIIITKGKFATFLREAKAMSIYYGTYYYLTDKQNFSVMLAGSITGVLSWLFTYPFDVIKTRQMTYNISFNKALKKGNLFKGINICLIRAFFVNSVAFYSYEFMIKNLKK
tara:strand:+ start:308 stop:961 length:654 start_codon:yes stop_codon:yes gene_type:complete